MAASCIDSIRAVSKNFRVEVKMRENYLKSGSKIHNLMLNILVQSVAFEKYF